MPGARACRQLPGDARPRARAWFPAPPKPERLDESNETTSPRTASATNARPTHAEPPASARLRPSRFGATAAAPGETAGIEPARPASLADGERVSFVEIAGLRVVTEAGNVSVFGVRNEL